jgi:hypothetical protein
LDEGENQVSGYRTFSAQAGDTLNFNALLTTELGISEQFCAGESGQYNMHNFLGADIMITPISELETWAMMVGGVAAIGFVSRGKLKEQT